MEALPEDYDRVPADTPDPQQLYADANLDADLQSALDSLAPSSAPPSCCAISRALVRGDRHHSGSSWARCAAASTAAGRRSATIWPATVTLDGRSVCDGVGPLASIQAPRRSPGREPPAREHR